MVRQFKLVDLTLNGDLAGEGCDVSLSIYTGFSSSDSELEKRSLIKKAKGKLPANPALKVALKQWRDSYHRLENIDPRIIAEGIELGGQLDSFHNAAENLKSCFLEWLISPEFRVIETALRNYCTLEDRIQLLLEIANKQDGNILQHLPWHLWPFVHERQYAEVAFQPAITQSPMVQTDCQTQDFKVLAILGYGGGINIDRDLELLTALKDVTVLQEPDRSEIDEQLWTQAWDILFFAGHSDSHHGKGRLYLNQNGDYLTIEELRSGLAKSIGQGLKLAIFNSCDGLGLAYELERLYFPQMIVMKEPIPDQIAHRFLDYFLQALQGTDSVYVALRTTRDRLRDLERKFPCASWLPVLFHNPATPTFKWSIGSANLANTLPSDAADEIALEQRKVLEHPPRRWRQILQAVVVSCLVASFIIGLRSFGILQALELKNYDHMMRWRPDHLGVDNRILVITIDQEDIAYQRSQGIKGEGSLSDQALLKTLQTVEPYGPSIVASDVIHDFEYSPELSTYLEKIDNFMGLCLVQVEDSDLDSIAPPPGLPVEQLGFVNFPLDPDAKVRRQFLEMQADSICKTESSLSFAIASYYLKQQDPNLVPEYLDNNHLRLGQVTFRKFSPDAGGYALPQKDAGGFQILINYRPKPPPTISLREFLVLGEVQLKSRIPGRMILIGVANGKSDQHRTPYDSDNLSSTAGVMVHAQMTSHLVSAALGEESPIRWWSVWAENLWLLVWGVWGALLVLIWQRNFLIQGLMVAGSSIVLLGICYFGLVHGLWIPFIPAWFIIVLAALSFSIYLTTWVRRYPNL